MQIIVVAGMCVIALGFLWIVLTLPVAVSIANLESSGMISTDASNTVTFLKIFPAVLTIFIGFSIMAWGWIKAVEEREYGVMLPE
jgi:hypothetical protein